MEPPLTVFAGFLFCLVLMTILWHWCSDTPAAVEWIVDGRANRVSALQKACAFCVLHRLSTGHN
ncbi:hypothetical protein GALMADRAFT_228852 [Galerina marginata CBS 339.88]|uniref:Uncharacterized protein n=1 Tax=Galerina marginata (strain CBS 339.88) TaxID=685588 RepID=A0A067T0M5_GALM3|nr:hypothetical protein GALMADRAFT_228852 [Galerina marginata CBS 339.88]